jgi:hypothetical protein
MSDFDVDALVAELDEVLNEPAGKQNKRKTAGNTSVEKKGRDTRHTGEERRNKAQRALNMGFVRCLLQAVVVQSSIHYPHSPLRRDHQRSSSSSHSAAVPQ